MGIHRISFLGMVDFAPLLHRFGIDWHLLIVQSLNFVLVTFVLYRFGFKNIVRLMDERRAKIESGLAYADSMQKEMAVFEKTRGERVSSAKKEAEDIMKSAQSRARDFLEQEKVATGQMVDGMIAGAQKAMAIGRAKMLEEAKAEIGTLVVDIAGQVLSSQMTDEERDRYVASAEKAVLGDMLG
jgi:F-type H+-transporting ATPase subunit b